MGNRIGIYLRGKGWEVVDWIDLAQEWNERRPVVNMLMNLRVP